LSIDLITAIVRGVPGCADRLVRTDLAAFLNAAKQQGMLPVIADRLSSVTVDSGVATAVQAEASGFVAADLYRERELRRVLDALAARGVRAVVFKGAALAYTHYARPDLRPRDDSDLLVPPEARATAHHTLVGLGYRPHQHVTGDLVSYQAIYEKTQNGVVLHVVDLHWRVANPQLFADALSFEEIDAAAQPIATLGSSARGPSAPHALFLACVHRVAHHRDEKLLMWIYDIHLLASRMTAGEWAVFLDLAARRKMMAICRQGLALSAEHFGTAVPPQVAEDSRYAHADAREEPSAAFMNRDRAQLSTFLSDLQALASWSDRGRLLKQHLCPPPAYMRQVYAPSSRAPLPALYMWRAVRGAWRWIARA
jgi:hypothetical protein